MKLNKEQLKEVEGYLTNKDVEYIDLHLEVLDHISSDIETLISEKNIDFTVAFEEVKLKWAKTFSYKWSFWLGLTNGGSKLFIDHCLRIYRPILIKGAATLLLFLILLLIFYKQIEVDFAPFQTFAKYSFLVFSIVYIFLIYYWKHKINLTGKNTTYYYLYKKTVIPNIAITALFILQISVFNDAHFDVSILMFSYVFLFNLYIGFSFYKNHIITIEKYQLQ